MFLLKFCTAPGETEWQFGDEFVVRRKTKEEEEEEKRQEEERRILREQNHAASIIQSQFYAMMQRKMYKILKIVNSRKGPVAPSDKSRAYASQSDSEYSYESD